MACIADLTYRDILGLQDAIRSGLQKCKSLEEAGQCVADHIRERFLESTALVRTYITVPYDTLPALDRAFAARVADAKGVADELREETTILSLMGTRGDEAAWNNRRQSQGHLAIPLVSMPFVESIPMVSRLLREMGATPFAAGKTDDTFVEIRLGAGQVGVFYVDDASAATDDLGRRIISAQDFVRNYGVKTVFGLGGIYSDGTIFVLLVFAKERLRRETVYALTHLIVLIKVATSDMLRENAVFANLNATIPG